MRVIPLRLPVTELPDRGAPAGHASGGSHGGLWAPVETGLSDGRFVEIRGPGIGFGALVRLGGTAR
jgi:hypothetical protein